MAIGGEPKFKVEKIQQLSLQTVVAHWIPKRGGYSDLEELLGDIRDINPNYHAEISTVRADRENNEQHFRFYSARDGGYGVLVLDRNNQGKYEPRSIIPHLPVVVGGDKELNGVEAVADYYFENSQKILGK